MNCQRNVNSTLPTHLPHKFLYIVAILGHNHFESPKLLETDKPLCSIILAHRMRVTISTIPACGIDKKIMF
jgi:hypothetical protein